LNDPSLIDKLLSDLFHNCPRTLVHQDMWINNWCYFEEKKQPCFLDWQTLVVGPGVLDLVLFLFDFL